MAHPHDLLEAPLIGMCGYEFLSRSSMPCRVTTQNWGHTKNFRQTLCPQLQIRVGAYGKLVFYSRITQHWFLTVTICSFSGLEGRMRSTECHSSFRSVYCRDRGMAVINNSITIKRERERGTAVGMGAQCRPQAWARQGGTCLPLETLKSVIA